MTQADKLVAVARGERGYLEKASNKSLDDKTANAGTKNYTKYGAWYGSNGQPWCAMFVSWCAHEAGISEDIIPRHASCLVGIRWFKKQKRWKAASDYTPKRGDIIYFQRGNDRHVGIVEHTVDGRVYTIEGNTSGGSTMISNGGAVCYKHYTLTYDSILGYGVPAYVEAVPTPPTEKGEDTMTGEEIYKALNAYLKTQKAPPWAERELAEAVEMGITDGTNPMQMIPRYQAAIMAKRAAEAALKK